MPADLPGARNPGLGARTLSADTNWIYINVRRLFLTVGRWIERNTPGAVFEPNDSRLWARITRDLTAYFNELFRQGALKGRTAQEAFYVKCDAETNSAEIRDLGMVVTEVGLAPAIPNEFVVGYGLDYQDAYRNLPFVAALEPDDLSDGSA